MFSRLSLFLLICSMFFMMATDCSSPTSATRNPIPPDTHKKQPVFLIDENKSTEIFGSYEIELVVVDGTDLSDKKQGNFPISFYPDYTATLNLEVNKCSGSFILSGESSIQFVDFACTEACCDSEAADRMIRNWHRIETYHIQNTKLLLKGEGISLVLSRMP